MNNSKHIHFKSIVLIFLLFTASETFGQNETIVKKIVSKYGLSVEKLQDVDSIYFPNKWYYIFCTNGTKKIYNAVQDIVQDETIIKENFSSCSLLYNISTGISSEGKKYWLIYEQNFSRNGWKPVKINLEDYDAIYIADPCNEGNEFIGVKNNQLFYFIISDNKIIFKDNLIIKDSQYTSKDLQNIIPFNQGFILSFLNNGSYVYKRAMFNIRNYVSEPKIDANTQDTIYQIIDSDNLGYFLIDKYFDADEIVWLPQKYGVTNAIIKKNNIVHLYNFIQNKIIYSGVAKYDIACNETPIVYTEHDALLFENEHYFLIPTQDLKSINYKKDRNDIIGIIQMKDVISQDKNKLEQNWEINFTQKSIRNLSNSNNKLPRIITSVDSLANYYNKELNRIKPSKFDSITDKRLTNLKLADQYFLTNKYDSALKYYESYVREAYRIYTDVPFRAKFDLAMGNHRGLLEDVDHDYLPKELSTTNPANKKLLCSFYYATIYRHSENSYRPIDAQIQAMNELIKQNEGVSEFYFYRGYLYAKSKMYPAAMADFDVMVKLNPSNDNYLRRSFYGMQNIIFAKHKKDKTFAQIPISDISYVIHNMEKENNEKNFMLYDLYALRAELNYYLRDLLNRSNKEIKKDICLDLEKNISFYELPVNRENLIVGELDGKKALQKKCKCK